MNFMSRIKKGPIKIGNGKTLGQQLKLLRKQKGISQGILGKRIGTSVRAICSYERDECEPPVQTLMALAKELGTTMDDLLGAATTQEPQTGMPRRWLRRVEKIQDLPENKQKALLQILDMALKS